MVQRATRRQFLMDAAAADGAGAAAARASARIEYQSHLFLPELIVLMEKHKNSRYAYRKDGATYDWVGGLMPMRMAVDAELADMDTSGMRVINTAARFRLRSFNFGRRVSTGKSAALLRRLENSAGC